MDSFATTPVDLRSLLPADMDSATLVARLWDPELSGPCVVTLRGDAVVDFTSAAPTVSDLFEASDPVEIVRAGAEGNRQWNLDEVLAATMARDTRRAHLLAPSDLQVIKACGVTFAQSMLERVIEERAAGDVARSGAIRAKVLETVGGTLAKVRAGSPEALRVRETLIKEGIWSQYLEVGIGVDAEVFTKAPVLSAVGLGAEIGVLRASQWNNPEPEAVLAVNSRGVACGATLGNDVNLRDIEGRSALLLGKAKDNNASCALGPWVRLFDEGFGLDDFRQLEITLQVDGLEGYRLTGRSSMREISRDPADLVKHAFGAHHQYPDGFMLFMGTLFTPTEDRDEQGKGFTHKLGDRVEITSPRLGRLINVVTHAESASPWTFGVRDLMRSLAARGLLSTVTSDRG